MSAAVASARQDGESSPGVVISWPTWQTLKVMSLISLCFSDGDNCVQDMYAWLWVHGLNIPVQTLSGIMLCGAYAYVRMHMHVHTCASVRQIS